MHELSLCRAIAATATDHADGRAVSVVRLQIGHFRQVVPTTLQFCWGVVTDGTDLAGCTLDIEHVPAVVGCAACGERTKLEQPILMCGSCGGRDVALESGEEFLIASIDVGAADLAEVI